MAVDPLHDAGGRLSPEAAAACVGELFEQHGRMVYAICRLSLRDRVEAEDAAQQAFLSAHRSLLSGTEPRDAAAWLGTIARNECRARIRSRMAEPLVLLRDDDPAQGDLEHLVAERGEIEALCSALRELPRSQRNAVVLREFYGLSYDEVGAALGVSEAAVDSLLVRARRRLHDALRPARIASGVIVVPAALRDSLAEALPGFASSGPGMLARVAALPVAAKLIGAAATVAVVGSVGAVGYRGADLPPAAKAPAAPPAAVAKRSTPTPQVPESEVGPVSAGVETEARDEDDNRGPGGGGGEDGEQENEAEDLQREGNEGPGSDDDEDRSGPGDGAEPDEPDDSGESGGSDDEEDE